MKQMSSADHAAADVRQCVWLGFSWLTGLTSSRAVLALAYGGGVAPVDCVRRAFLPTPPQPAHDPLTPPSSSGSLSSSSLARPVQQSSLAGERSARLHPHRRLW
jgi:hypothetical protein